MSKKKISNLIHIYSSSSWYYSYHEYLSNVYQSVYHQQLISNLLQLFLKFSKNRPDLWHGIRFNLTGTYILVLKYSQLLSKNIYVKQILHMQFWFAFLQKYFNFHWYWFISRFDIKQPVTKLTTTKSGCDYFNVSYFYLISGSEGCPGINSYVSIACTTATDGRTYLLKINSLNTCLMSWIQLGAVLAWPNITSYCNPVPTDVEHKSNFKFKFMRGAQYIALSGKIWGVHCADFIENLPCFYGTIM